MSRINICCYWLSGLGIVISSAFMSISIQAQQSNLEQVRDSVNSSYTPEPESVKLHRIFRLYPLLPDYDSPWKFLYGTAWFAPNNKCFGLPLLTIAGRGGIPASPTEPLMGDAVLTDWVKPDADYENRARDTHSKKAQEETNTKINLEKFNSVNSPTQIVEAQGWVVDANHNVFLVAQSPSVKFRNSLFTSVTCILPQH